MHDPETYCAAVAAILADGFSKAVVDYVTDPRTGIPSQCRFLPTVAEVREACEARAAFLERMSRYEGRKPVRSDHPPVRHGEITYKEFLERNGEARPIGRFE